MKSTDKHSLRQQCRDKRQALPLAQQINAQAAILAHLNALAVYQQAQHIAFYHAITGEIDLSPLLSTALDNRINCYLPHVNTNHTLSFLPLTATTHMRLNRYGIPEPDVPITQAISPQAIDLMCIPLLAYDTLGHRLGHGGGYYDRTLAHTRPGCLLGVAYSVQCQPLLPTDPWDITLDGVVTEHGVHWFTR